MNKKVNNGGPAFPWAGKEVREAQAFGLGIDKIEMEVDVSYPGMSIRDWFAGQVIAGLSFGIFASAWSRNVPPSALMEGNVSEELARTALYIADALLIEREK